MNNFKFTIDLADGSRVWINLLQMIKMVKTPDDNYYIYLINGERYLITYRQARTIENFFQD